MTVPALKPTGQAAVQAELLSRLGLPASASPEDVDQLHQSVSHYLAAAPPEIRGWARAQVAALDTAYLQLTDPVGLEGSALMSPASPPSVVPGGPATPPARRGPDPVDLEPQPPADATADEPDLEIEGEPTADDLAALYAMVTPSAHEDMKPRAKATPVAGAAAPRPAAGKATATAGKTPAPAAAPGATQPNVWKGLFLGTIGVVLLAAVALGANALINGAVAAPTATDVAQASPGAPAIDQAKVSALMSQYQADPTDEATLLALADEFYAGGMYEDAATWLDRLLEINPEHIDGLLARGAVDFNLGNLDDAEAAWLKVVALAPDNVEVHYDLGFLYLNQPTPDWAGVQSEWTKVIELDPGSALAQTVQSHLDSLAVNSMLPDSSAAPSAAPTAAPSVSAAP
jgi:hypothetical protein